MSTVGPQTTVARWMFSFAMMVAISACGTSSNRKVNELNPESLLPSIPSGVPRGEGELVESKDLFRGKKVVIQIESTEGRVARDYRAEREMILSTKPIREQNGFMVFDSVGEADKRPDGFVYVKTAPESAWHPDWFVSCVRWKPKWEDTHGCVLLGEKAAKHYEVDLEESELSVAEELNKFVLAHL